MLGFCSHVYFFVYFLNLSRPIPGRREKANLNFYLYTFLCASKDFMKASKAFIKAFIKAFEAPQRSLKIKIYVNFYFIQLSEMHWAGKVKINIFIAWKPVNSFF